MSIEDWSVIVLEAKDSEKSELVEAVGGKLMTEEDYCRSHRWQGIGASWWWFWERHCASLSKPISSITSILKVVSEYLT